VWCKFLSPPKKGLNAALGPLPKRGFGQT